MQTSGMTLKVLNPRGRRPAIDEIPAVSPIGGLEGKKIGILNNAKGGGEEILSFIEKALTEKIPDIRLRTWRVPFAMIPSEKEPRLKEIADYSDGVLALMGD
jgi:hypothetical protein